MEFDRKYKGPDFEKMNGDLNEQNKKSGDIMLTPSGAKEMIFRAVVDYYSDRPQDKPDEMEALIQIAKSPGTKKMNFTEILDGIKEEKKRLKEERRERSKNAQSVTSDDIHWSDLETL